MKKGQEESCPENTTVAIIYSITILFIIDLFPA